ncbi:MAG TPA: glycine cleavage system protein T, partial [Bacteroidia bacterium]|nr:glycine cleavage system protein T [Bacteroidia bacterium]
MNRSPLHDRHLALGARMVPFAGWEMPIQYRGIVAEHQVVREGVGVFDISHMGEFQVSGAGAAAWLDGLLTNEVAALGVGQGQYTLLLNDAGGVIDDLIVYRLGEERFFLVVNAARIDEDREWLLAHPGEGVSF